MPTTSGKDDQITSFLTHVLQPGSSLDPTFLLIVDGVLASLLVVLLSLLWLSSGNIHVAALIAIEMALWASVKWFVNELRNISLQQSSTKIEKHPIEQKKEQ